MMPFVYVYDPTRKDHQSQVRGVGRYIQILKENFGNEFRFVSAIGNLPVRQAGWKLEIGNSVFINPFFNFLQPPLTLKRIAKKQIAVIHDLIPLKYPDHFPAGLRGSLNIFLNRLALKNYNLIVTDSESSKKDIIEKLKVKSSKLKVIYPCLPKIYNKVTSSKKQVEGINKNYKNSPNYSLLTTNYCLYVGDATWNKNLVNLARAIKIINVTCVFVGAVFKQIVKTGVPSQGSRQRAEFFQPVAGSSTGGKDEEQDPSMAHLWQKELREFLQETKNDKRFIFTGFLPDNQLIKLYQQATVNVLVSRAEGFGFSYLEAASQACPSTLSDIEVLQEVAAQGGASFADPKDPNDIANKIGEIYFNRELRQKLGLKAQQRSQFFSPREFKRQFVDLVNF